MAKCLNPVKLSVGVRKDKTLYIPTRFKIKNKDLYELDCDNKRPEIILAPCGKCYNCRVNRARDWTIRTIHEYSRPKFSRTFMYFLTLTYDDEHICDNSLDYRHVQLFLKKLRKKFACNELKFLCVGEYGFKSNRMHWHLIIFGFPKLVKYRVFHDLWSYGLVDAGLVRSYSSVSYLLKYCMKEYKNPKIDYLIDGRIPPLFRCSKSFGKEYAEKNLDQFIADGYIQHNKYKYRIPRFYRELYYKINFIDGWQEFDNNKEKVAARILKELRQYNFTDIVSNLEVHSNEYYSAFLKVMRPIYLKENEMKFENYLKRLNEKV